MKLFKFTILALLGFTLASCAHNKTSKVTHINDLLISNVENVAFELDNSASLEIIKEWINDERPDEAVIVCNNASDSELLCTNLEQSLKILGVEVSKEFVTENLANNVTLTYHRTVGMNCPVYALGCSVSANIIQSVGDTRQLVSPAVMPYGNSLN